MVGRVFDQMKNRRVSVFSRPGMQIQIKMTETVSVLLVRHDKASDLFVPAPVGSLGQFFKDQSQQFLVHVEGGLDDMIEREIGTNGFGIDPVLLYEKSIVVKGSIPGVQFTVKFLLGFLVVFLFELEECLAVGRARLGQFGLQVGQKLVDGLVGATHAFATHEFRPTRIAQQSGNPFSQLHALRDQLQIVGVRVWAFSCLGDLPSRLTDVARLSNRNNVGILECDRTHACFFLQTFSNKILPTSLQFMGCKIQFRIVLRQIRAKFATHFLVLLE